MSENFEMIVDPDVTIDKATLIAERVLKMFRAQGLITGEANPDCVLDGLGYQPGPAVLRIYTLGEDEQPFWLLKTCGVECRVGRDFNHWALGPSCTGFRCPNCRVKFEPDEESLDQAIEDAIGEWLDESGPAHLRCPRCDVEMPITQWRWEPPLGSAICRSCSGIGRRWIPFRGGLVSWTS